MYICNSAASGEQARFSLGALSTLCQGCSCNRLFFFQSPAVSADAAPMLASPTCSDLIHRRQLVPGFLSSYRISTLLLCLLYQPDVESWGFLRWDFRTKKRVLPRSLSQPMALAWQPREAQPLTQWHHSEDHFSCKAQNLRLGEPCRLALFSIFAPFLLRLGRRRRFFSFFFSGQETARQKSRFLQHCNGPNLSCMGFGVDGTAWDSVSTEAIATSTVTWRSRCYQAFG